MFEKLTDLIIGYLEGGYYHPDMKSKLRGGENMGDSGETMFGFDRKHGGELVTSEKGKEFWRIVDENYSSHHGDTKYYNDKADGKLISAAVGEVLRRLVTEIMTIQFNKYTDWLTPAAKELVMSSPALLMQFWYACWNGPGRFQVFAQLVNAAVANGTTARADLYSILDKNRRSWGAWAAQRADTITEICNKHLGGISAANDGGSSLWKWLLAGVAVFGLVKIISKK